MTLVYVAAPYSSPIASVLEYRYNATCDFVDYLIEKGVVAFSPVVYCHPIAKRIGRGTAAADWVVFNTSVLRRCDGMYVLCLKGWQQSIGLKHEFQLALMANIPLTFFDDHFHELKSKIKVGKAA